MVHVAVKAGHLDCRRRFDRRHQCGRDILGLELGA